MMNLEGWKTVTIEECCDILDSKRIPINTEEREERVGSIPYYGANGLQGYIDDYIFDEDLILIAEDGGYFNEFATRPIAYKVSGKSWINNHAHVLKAKVGYCQSAIFYYLEHKDIQPFIVGGTRSKLNQSGLRSIALDIPELESEQTQIAAILSTIDRAIEQTEAIIAKQQRIKTGLMQDLLTKGIDEDGNVRSEATHKFKDSPLGRIPVEWEFFSIQDIASKDLHSTAIGPFGSNLVASDYREEGVPVVFVRDLKESIFSWISNVFVSQKKAKELKAHWVSSNDVVATKMGLPPCIAAVYPNDMPEGIITADIIKLTPNRIIADSTWVAMFLNTESVRSQVRQITGGVTRPKITLHDFRNLIIVLPKKEEQEQIIYAIESINNQIKKSILEIKKYQKTKIGLMQDLLTGNVRVTALLNDQETAKA